MKTFKSLIKMNLIFTLTFLIISCAKDSDILYNIVKEQNENETEISNSEEITDNEMETMNPENDTANDEIDISDSESNIINMSQFGVVGDGETDDTAALQLAFNSGKNLVSNSNLNLRITKTLKINGNGDQIIDFNGSVLSVDVSNYITDVLVLDKPSGKATLLNLTINGNYKALRGLSIYSISDLFTIKVKELYQPANIGQGIYGIRVALGGFNGNYKPNSEGTYTWNDIEIYDIDAASSLNGETGGALGSANGMTVFWDAVLQNQINLNITNLEIHDIWGTDSGCLYTETRFDSDASIAATNSLMTITNANFYNSERRRGKLFGGNATYINCTFTSPNGNDSTLPFVTYLDPDGECSGDGTFCDAGNVGISADRSTFINCVFDDPHDYDSRVIGVNFGDITFENCKFLNGSDLAFTLDIGDTYICDSFFGKNTTAFPYGSNDWNGKIHLDPKNLYEETYSTFVSSISPSYIDNDLICN